MKDEVQVGHEQPDTWRLKVRHGVNMKDEAQVVMEAWIFRIRCEIQVDQDRSNTWQ